MISTFGSSVEILLIALPPDPPMPTILIFVKDEFSILKHSICRLIIFGEGNIQFNGRSRNLEIYQLLALSNSTKTLLLPVLRTIPVEPFLGPPVKFPVYSTLHPGNNIFECEELTSVKGKDG
jgi:hypothetical protein